MKFCPLKSKYLWIKSQESELKPCLKFAIRVHRLIVIVTRIFCCIFSNDLLDMD